MTLRPLVVTVALLLSSAATVAQQRPAPIPQMPQATPSLLEASVATDARISRIELWLKALVDHEQGFSDAALTSVASWWGDDLQSLWLDLNSVVRLMRSPGTVRFSYQLQGESKPRDIRYSPAQLQRLRAFACIASGTAREPACVTILRQRAVVDDDLLEIAIRVQDAEDGDNFILRRGAMLHTDIAILKPAPSEPRSIARYSRGAGGYRVQMQDGRQMGLSQIDDHWKIARGLLEYIRPVGSNRPAPGRDDMVRLWYRATAAWMQDAGDHETAHLTRARELFPTDPDILFLSGSQHETYASSAVQSVRENAVLPAGVTLMIDSEGRELRQAETFFRRSIAAKRDQPEAHLRLGHVLGQLNRHADAVPELDEALSTTSEDLLRYFGLLMLGTSQEALGRYDDAQASFEKASKLYPTAQSPYLALTELARRRGDRTAALKSIQEVFDLPWSQFQRYDPWWDYDVAQSRNVGDLLKELRRPFLHGERR
jgi:tetratricopeptide (TPR) repeat protein